MSAGTIWQRKHGGTRFGAKLLLENGVTFNLAMYRAPGLACAAAVAAGYWYPRAHPHGCTLSRLSQRKFYHYVSARVYVVWDLRDSYGEVVDKGNLWNSQTFH